ncbi:MAG: hypothetical protein NC417_01030 [Candidatus Gastranaerophilales bacterium]|nr:hypothetical protein [Candidatus Gastranaerophilales bacterium]
MKVYEAHYLLEFVILMRKINYMEILYFLAGLVATFQVTQVFGVTIFTFMVFLIVALSVLYYKRTKISKKSMAVYAYFFIAGIAEIVGVTTIDLPNKMEWIVPSLKKFILLFVLVLLYSFITDLKKNNVCASKGL